MHTEESQGTFLHTDGWCQVNPFPQTTPRHGYIRDNTECVRQISKSDFEVFQPNFTKVKRFITDSFLRNFQHAVFKLIQLHHGYQRDTTAQDEH